MDESQWKNENVYGPDTRKKIEETRKYPYSCIGLVTGRFGTIISNGSGCLIGPDIVLTCAHNLYDRENKIEANNVFFCPGLNGSIGEQFKVKSFHYLP